MVLSKRTTLVVASAVLLGLGLTTAAVGVSLATLAQQTGNTVGELGALFTAMFIGSMTAQLISGPVNDRFDQRPTLLVGIALVTIGMIGLTLSQSLLLVLACALLTGMGSGSVLAGVSVLVAEVYAERAASALNMANVFFGLGAVVGPAVAGLSLRTWGTPFPAFWGGVTMLLLLAPLVPFLMTMPRMPRSRMRAARSVYRSPLLWALSLMILLYVGAEVGVSGWTAVYVQRTTGMEVAEAALVASGFWLALTAGRMLGALAGTRMTAQVLLLICAGGAAGAGLLLAMSVGNIVLTIGAVLLLGLFFGPIFPTGFAITTASFPQAPGAAGSVFMAVGSLGGALIPWVQGTLLERNGPPAAAFVTTVVTMLVFVIYLGILLSQRQARPAVDSTAC